MNAMWTGAPLDRDTIVAAVDLAALAEALLGPSRGSRGSPAWPCPVAGHDPTSPFPPHFSIFTTRHGGQRWACENCGADGTAIDLVMASQGLGFRDALEFLARRAGITRPGLGSAPAEDATPGHHEPRMVRTGIDAWVDRASELLWEPFGTRARDWLTTGRGLPGDVLRLHRVGATTVTLPAQALATRRSVTGPRTSWPAVVLPVITKDQAIFAQLRLVYPPEDTGSYVNPRSTAGHHPRIGLYRPPRRAHPEILVTEGIIDALTANAAGYRAAAILSPGLADAATAVHLARLKGPLVLALDPDRAGDLAADRLAQLLWANGRRPAFLAELGQDLNDSMNAARAWPRKLTAHVQHAVASTSPDRVPGL